MADEPTMLYVPIPSGKFQRRYGVFSTRHPEAHRITVRLGIEQRDAFIRAARILDMTEAEFVREGITALAKAIIKHVDEHKEKHNVDPSDGSG
jgi:hypothetical protein